jgi:hypothetical protein
MMAREKDESNIKDQVCVVNLLKIRKNTMMKEVRETHREKTSRSFMMDTVLSSAMF